MKLEDLKIEDEELLKNIETLIQSETDKVRTKYSQEGKGKDKTISELEEELKKYKPQEQKKDEKDLKIDELTKTVNQLVADKKKSQIESILENSKLPKGFSKYLINSDNIEEDVKGLQEMFKEQLKDYTPSNTHVETKKITKEDFEKMGFEEQCNFAESNPTLYESFTK